MPDRLLWKEIQEKYPDQWVALEDVKFMNDDGCNVESAIVLSAMSDDEYISSRLKFIREGKDYKYRRTEDMRGFIGVTI